MSKAIFEDGLNRLSAMRLENLKILDSVPSDKREIIPDKFRNSMYWQAGHLLAVQDSLLYTRSGLEPPHGAIYKKYFGKGSSPNDFDSEIPTWEQLRQQLEISLVLLRDDSDRLIDGVYSEAVKTSTCHTLISSLEAMQFLSIHDAVHCGMIIAMLKHL